jgi:hypothetical protein
MPVKKKARGKAKRRRISRDEVMRLVEAFDGEVNNGGFDQLFRNSLGNETAQIIQALAMIGADKIANILKRAARRFPDGKPPKDRAKREQLMESISTGTDAFDDLDQEFYACSEELQGFLEKYMDWV